MSPDRRPEADETGTPIPELARLAEEPREGFIPRVRRSISRRVLANQVVDYFWYTPFLVFFEFLKLAFGALGGESSGKGEQD